MTDNKAYKIESKSNDINITQEREGYYMNKLKSRKHLRITVLLLLIVLLTGTAFAAASGVLVFDGSIAISSPANLYNVIIRPTDSNNNGSGPGLTSYAFYPSQGSQEVSVNIEFSSVASPGTFQNVGFEFYNGSTEPINVTGFTLNSFSGAEATLPGFINTSMSNLPTFAQFPIRLEPGQASSAYHIHVGLLAGFEQGVYPFTIMCDFEAAV